MGFVNIYINNLCRGTEETLRFGLRSYMILHMYFKETTICNYPVLSRSSFKFKTLASR